MGVKGPGLGQGEPTGTSRTELATLFSAAASGDQAAWDSLVNRLSGLVWSICRSYRLSAADAADAFQFTWLRLLEHLDAIQEPTKLPGWLATTCRRECLALLRRRKRTVPVADDRVLDHYSDPVSGADQPMLVLDQNAALWRAFAQLKERCQQILWILVIVPETGAPSYAAASEALGIPIGSLGPMRGRCLVNLRELLALEGISGPLTDS